jgi:23S rRNA pseudouridine2605 synthase
MRDRPHPNHKLEWPGGVVPEWARPQQNGKKRFGRGGKGAAGGAQGGKGGGKRERLQKVMAQSGYGSRRNIEILIAQGHLTVNGQAAKLGDSVGPGDKVKLDGNLINLRYGEQLPRVLLYHKPAGEIVSRDDPEKRATVFDKLPKVHGGRWVSVGRLDFNTEGLLIFTTNGELANRLTHPRFEVEREYAVRVMGELNEEQQEKLLKTGVDIEGELCTFDSIEDRGGEGSNHWYHVILREGKNREVRRMMEGVGLMVSRLMRVRFGSVTLPGHIKRGMMREMEEEQIQELMAFAGMNEPSPDEAGESEVDDALENIGNRIDHRREAREREIDDDIGNKVHAHAQAHAPAPEPDGNRGTYDPMAGEHPPKAQRRPHGGPDGGGGRGGGGKPFFKKQRGQGQGRDGNVAAPQGQFARGDGQPHQGQGHAQGHGQGQGQGQGKRRKKRHGQGHAQGQGGSAAPQGGPQGQPGATPAGQPGQGKPGRNRRHKNRNRNRGAQGGNPQGGNPQGGNPQGGNPQGGNPQGGNQGGGSQGGGGEQQPQHNGNRETL